MKTYPHILGPAGGHKKPCYAFVKYDGSNLRFEWSKKRGWYKFGTRNCMIDESDPIFGPAIPLFIQKYGEDLPKVFRSSKLFRGVDNVIVFAEYFGTKSFAGMHLPDSDQQWDIVCFDVNPIKKGFLGPKQFLDEFGHLKVAELVYTGNFGEWLVQSVRKEVNVPLESNYDVKTEIPEGVICKGSSGHDLWMCKIKTERYKEALKVRYRMDWEKFWE